MLFYDIAITFGEEVEVIWARKFTMVSLLWFLVRRFAWGSFPVNYNFCVDFQNRYLMPLGFIVITVCECRNEMDLAIGLKEDS